VGRWCISSGGARARDLEYINFDLDTIYIKFYDDQYFYLPLYEIES